MLYLAIEIRFLDSRFHGMDRDGRAAEWPPSPARLFQALVAATAKGSVIEQEDQKALSWLQDCEPPVIAAPAAHPGQPFSHFMPNNNLDAEGGDPKRIAKVRLATKHYRPLLFDATTPLLYIWSFDGNENQAKRICYMAEHVYQLGRGVDMAWANADVLSEEGAAARLEAYPGAIHRPAGAAREGGWPCPIQGTLQSLLRRYQAASQRFHTLTEPAPTKKEPGGIKVIGQTLAQPPKPRFRPIAYDCTPDQFLFELRTGSREAGFFPWPLHKTVKLVETVRDKAAVILEKQYQTNHSDNEALVKRVFGLCRETMEADKARRIRILPLPSIGHPHVDQAIRRVLVEVPPNCPMPAEDIVWAFSSVSEFDAETGEIGWMLVRAGESSMTQHYGVGKEGGQDSRIWRSVTPLVLPIARPYGRVQGMERTIIERRAAASVVQALRHANAPRYTESIRMQREPFDTKGLPAQDFAPGSRFSPRNMWHVEIQFSKPTYGPLVIGNGRYLGLGLMRPIKQIEGVFAFQITDGLDTKVDAMALTRALRRAVMARVQDKLGKRTELPVFFTGHEPNGEPARRGYRSHLAYTFDAPRQRLLVLAPYMLEHREPSKKEREHLHTLSVAITGLQKLRAGAAGKLTLRAETVDIDSDPLFASSTRWRTQTEYCLTRHPKREAVERAVVDDVIRELERRRLPKPVSVSISSVSRGPRGALHADINLNFSVGITGPILLGQTSNLGGGLFIARQTPE